MSLAIPAALALSLSTIAHAQSKDEEAAERYVVDNPELSGQCRSEAGIDALKESDFFQLKPDVFQAAALRNQGVDVDTKYDKDVREACERWLEEAPSAASPFDLRDGIRFSFDPDGPVWVPIPTPEPFKREEAHCSASWDDDCEEMKDYYVPSGYQACAINYIFAWDGDVDDPIITPVGWFNGDKQDPDRFRGFRITLKARGNGDLMFPDRGRVWAQNVEIFGIPADADNEVRFKAGCHLPPNPIESEGVTIPPLPD